VKAQLLDRLERPTMNLCQARSLRIDGSVEELVSAIMKIARVEQAPAAPVPAPQSEAFGRVLRWVSLQTGVPAEVIQASGRAKPALRARMATVWGARRLLGLSSAEIGRQLGRRDHTTILHCETRACALIDDDPAFCNLIARLQLAHKGDAL
jgi:chromosomal replication initiator protein